MGTDRIIAATVMRIDNDAIRINRTGVRNFGSTQPIEHDTYCENDDEGNEYNKALIHTYILQ